jgi:hypothetical protein
LTTWAKIVSWVLFGIGGILIVIALIQAADEIGSGYSIFEAAPDHSKPAPHFPGIGPAIPDRGDPPGCGYRTKHKGKFKIVEIQQEKQEQASEWNEAQCSCFDSLNPA